MWDAILACTSIHDSNDDRTTKEDLDHASNGCCCSISTSDSWYRCYSSQAVLRKHSRTSAVLRTFVFQSFRMLRTICCTKQFTLLQMTSLLANILDQDHRILALVSFTVYTIVLRTILSPCRYRYLPRSTEPIPLVPHPVVQQTMSIYHCRYSPFIAAAVISVSQVILSLSSCCCCCRCRLLHPQHKSQHLSLAGAQPLERVYCHESRYVSYSLNCSPSPRSIANIAYVNHDPKLCPSALIPRRRSP
jgi:hypothetical protein